MDAPISVYAKYVPLRVSTTCIDEKGVSQNIDADVVTDATDAPVTWGTASETSWYVVTGKDVKLSQGSICVGHVNLILADGAKLTATGDATQAGICVSGRGNSLTIYGQTYQSGKLEAKVDAGAGIGGGSFGNGSNITINGGTVTAIGFEGDGIGGGVNGHGEDIFVATNLIVKAGASKQSATTIENTGSDLASSLAGKRYVTITEPFFNITANQDPDHKQNYYSTFYSRTCDFRVPESVTAYTGVVDGSVLRLTAIEGGIIPTGEAVILRLTSADNTATKKQFDLTALITSATRSSSNALKGTDEATTLSANQYALSLGGNGVGFYLWEGKQIGANKAYLTLDDNEGENAKAFTFQFDDGEATAIEQPTISGKQSSDTYNLNGVRVDENYKGIVIKNGKKVLQK